MSEPVDPAGHRGWSPMKVVAALEQLDACIKQGTMCGYRKFSMRLLRADKGELIEPLEMVSGIRQKCPLAPLFFRIAAAILTLAIHQDTEVIGARK